MAVVERGRAAQLVAGRPGVPEGDRPTLVVLVQVRALQLQHPQHAPVRDLPASLAQARGRPIGVPELVPVVVGSINVFLIFLCIFGQLLFIWSISSLSIQGGTERRLKPPVD